MQPTGRPVAVASTVAVLAGSTLGGAASAVLALAVHRMAWRVGDVPLPWGLALAGATPPACGVAAGLLTGRRSASLTFAAGWLLVLLAVMLGRPEGDYLVAADALGWGYLLLGMAGVALTVGWALVRSPPRPSDE